jgi:hypothetical protein
MINLEERELLISPYYTSDSGDLRQFKRLPLEVLQKLIDGGFVDMDEWNDCPGVDSLFLPYLEKHPSYRAHGYVISADRDDTRVTVEGIESSGPLSGADIKEFIYTFKAAGADEIGHMNGVLGCWFD